MLPGIYKSFKLNDDLQKPRDFHISFEYRFDGLQNIYPDIFLDLYIIHNYKFLIVDEPVKILGNATLYTKKANEIESIMIGFQNAQSYPIYQNAFGITQPGFININTTQQNDTLTGASQIVWTLEGTYYPYIIISSTNNTSIRYDETQDVFITVYPKTQLAQIVTNNATFSLAFAVYLLTFIGVMISYIYTFNSRGNTINKRGYKKQNGNEENNILANGDVIK